MPDTSLALFRDGGLAQISDPVGPYFYGENMRLKATIIGKNRLDASNPWFNYYTATSVTFNVSIGSIHGSPTRGSFQLGTGAATAAGIPHNATTTQLKNAISGVYGNVTVTTYGRTTADGWIITAATANTALTLNGQSESLSPYSAVNVLDLTAPATGVTAQKIVRLRRSPAISVTTFGLPTNTVPPTLTVTTQLVSDRLFYNYRVNIEEDMLKIPYRYYFRMDVTGAITASLNLAFLQTNTPPAQLFSSGDNPHDFPANRGALLHGFYGSFGAQEGGPLFTSTTTNLPGFRGAVTSWVAAGVTYYGWRMREFAFFNETAVTGTGYGLSINPHAGPSVVSVALSIVTRGAGISGDGYWDLGTVTMSGAQIDELFEEANKNEVALTLEVNLTEAGRQQTLLQAPLKIFRTVA